MSKEKIKLAYDNLPQEDKEKIRDIFIQLLQENHFEVVAVRGLKVDSKILPSHPRLKFLTLEEKASPHFPENILIRKRRRKVEALESKITVRLNAKAIKKFFLTKE